MDHVAQFWEVVGGADKGGIIVRQGQSLQSAQLADRLATGALIEEIDLTGERLHYKLSRGSGPREGWISLRMKDKVIVQRCDKQEAIAKDTSAENTDGVVEERVEEDIADAIITAQTLEPTAEETQDSEPKMSMEPVEVTRQKSVEEELEEALALADAALELAEDTGAKKLSSESVEKRVDGVQVDLSAVEEPQPRQLPVATSNRGCAKLKLMCVVQ